MVWEETNGRRSRRLCRCCKNSCGEVTGGGEEGLAPGSAETVKGEDGGPNDEDDVVSSEEGSNASKAPLPSSDDATDHIDCPGGPSLFGAYAV